MHLFTFSLTVGSLVACAGGVAAPVAPPRPASTDRAPARVAKNDPLIVDWPNAARGKFEARTRKGVVAIRYVNNTMNLVDDCTTGQPYRRSCGAASSTSMATPAARRTSTR